LDPRPHLQLDEVIVKFPSFRLLPAVILVFLASTVFAEPPGEQSIPDVFSRLENAGQADDHEGADHLIVFTEAVNNVKPSGVTYVDGYDLTKVLTGEGCRDQSVLTWHYDPQSSHVEVREVNIVREGELIPVDVSAVNDLPAPRRRSTGTIGSRLFSCPV